ncbi:MAG TPA: response regulator, partial [Candidatus Saccharimonadales bacterium]|nr:response regulator [Candidatus Saccharimonadales bacterium]
AMDYLGGLGNYQNRAEHPLPCLIVLDLNLPRVHGLEVLRWLRQHESVRTQLVVVFTSSTSEVDIQEAYELGANSYLVKPGNPDQLVDTIKLLEAYWLVANQFPPVVSKTPRVRR